uniref:Gag-Pol polyprotein n=1 Tax=Tanacetum cinerariifolium TaxID=118510 RepID=A0A6L2NCV1_TANCI|nr:Gag-Pol polyprotein [Tanacetum cinerariifolium]
MNYLEEQTDGEAMINSIQNGDHSLPIVAQVLLAGTAPNAIPTLKDPKFWTDEEKQTRKIDLINDLKKCGYKKDNCELNQKFLNNLQLKWKQYGTLMRQTKNLMDINIDALYNILKQNQGDVNDALRYKKKFVVVTSDPLALVAEKTKVSKRKEKVKVQIESEGSDDDDISDLKKITALLAKVFNRKKFYAKPTNNNLRTSSASSANKKPEYVKSVEKKEDKKADEKKRDMSKVKCYNCKKEVYFAKDCKKSKVKDYNYYKTKMLLAKKDSDEQVLLDEDQAWMASSSDSDQEINANMVFMAKMEKVLSDSDESSSSVEETIAEKRIEKANQQSKDLKNQNKDLQDKYDVLINQENTFEDKNNELNEQMKVLNKKNADLLAQTEVLQDQLKVKHVVINTHTECQAQYAKLEEERYEYVIRYSTLCDNGKQHRKKSDEQEILFDKISRIGFENLSYFEKAKDLRTSLYDEKVIGLGYTIMFLTHSNEALKIKKFKRARENKIEFAYDYGNLKASYVNEKINFSDDYFQEIINPDFEKIDSPFQQTSSLKPYVLTVVHDQEFDKEALYTYEEPKTNRFEEEVIEATGEPTMEEYMTKTREDYGSGIARPKIVEKARFELKGTNREDAVEHIGKFLKKIDSLDIPNVTHDQHRLSIFSILLNRASSKWLMDEPKDSIITLVDLTDFVRKYYLPFRTGRMIEANGTNTKDEWDPTNIEFEKWLASLFRNHKTILRMLYEIIGEEDEKSSDDAWRDYSPIDERKDYEHTTCNETDVSSNRNTYNNICQIIIDHYETQEKQGCVDEHELMQDEDDDIGKQSINTFWHAKWTLKDIYGVIPSKSHHYDVIVPFDYDLILILPMIWEVYVSKGTS